MGYVYPSAVAKLSFDMQGLWFGLSSSYVFGTSCCWFGNRWCAPMCLVLCADGLGCMVAMLTLHVGVRNCGCCKKPI